MGRPRKHFPERYTEPAIRLEPVGPEPLALWPERPATLRTEDAARLLRVSDSTLHEWVMQQDRAEEAGESVEDRIPRFRQGRILLFDSELLREWFCARCRRAGV